MGLHVAIGTSSDDYTSLIDAAESRSTLNWVLPKAATVGDRVILFDRARGFVAHALCASPTSQGMFLRRKVYRADIGTIVILPVPVPLARVRYDMEDWAWTSYPRTYTTIDDHLATRLWTIVNVAQTLADQDYVPTLPAQEFTEGQKAQVLATRYERNPKARDACLQHHGTACVVCGFDFASVYGEGFTWCITAHHLKLVSTRGGEHRVDPIEEMRPVCSNCHTVIHQRSPPFEIEEVQTMIRMSLGEEYIPDEGPDDDGSQDEAGTDGG